MIDKKTSYLSLPLPHAENALAEDCPRLAEALTTLDGHAQSADARLDGVEASVTTLQQNIHAIDASAEQDIDALQSVQAAHTSELSDIKTSMAALGADSVHKTGDETISGAKTFTEKLFLAPKEDDRWLQTYIYGAENTLSLKIQNRIEPEDLTGELPARSSITLQGEDSGQGRFTLRAQSKTSSTGDGYKQWELLGTSDGSLSWTGGNYSSRGDIEIVDSSDFSSSIGYIRYSSGLQICYGYVNCVNYGYNSKYSQFTFPVAFKNTAYQVTVCPLSNNVDVVANIKSGRTTTYCSVGVRNLSQTSNSWTADVLIHAIGYWK